MHKIKITKKAQKEFKKIPNIYQKKISKAINELAETPMPSSVKKMRGAANRYRIRVADYRVIYDIDDGEMVILVIKVGHRQQVYKRL